MIHDRIAPDPRVTSAPQRARREFAIAVLGCALGAGMVLIAAARAWAVEVSARPAPLPPVTEAVTGDALAPWVTPVGVVAFAGAAALLAARRGRPVIGILLACAGVLLTVGSCYGWAVAADGDRTSTGLWPAVAIAGGLMVVAVGVATVRRGRAWPSLGARFERAVNTPPAAATGRRADQPGANGVDAATLWDALDRGEDPTRS